jgi:hypothetical protein
VAITFGTPIAPIAQNLLHHRRYDSSTLLAEVNRSASKMRVAVLIVPRLDVWNIRTAAHASRVRTVYRIIGDIGIEIGTCAETLRVL